MRFAQNRYKAPVEIMSREGGFLLISTDSREWDAADCLFSGKMIAFLALFLPVKVFTPSEGRLNRHFVHLIGWK